MDPCIWVHLGLFYKMIRRDNEAEHATIIIMKSNLREEKSSRF
jgi:hypothetical protein